MKLSTLFIHSSHTCTSNYYYSFPTTETTHPISPHHFLSLCNLQTPKSMANDAVFRSSLLWLALFILLIGLCTHSFKKMVATYFYGMFAIAGVLLPDWDFFDRDVSQWCTTLTVEQMNSAGSTQPRFKFYPVRMVIYSIVYGYGFYKWWTYVLT